MNKRKGITTLIISACLSFLISLSFLSADEKPLQISNIEVIKKVSTTGKINRKSIDYIALEKTFRGYSDEDITCLARNIYFEARNQSVIGQYAVAWVTINRKNHNDWPNTICKVVHQRKQFSWTIKYRYNKTYDKLAFRRATLIAKDSLYEAHNGGEDLSKGALYYHADYVNPKWNKRVIKIAQIETHIFYK